MSRPSAVAVRGTSVALLLAGLASCDGSTEPKTGRAAAATMRGTVTSPQRIALPPDAVLEVSLHDVSRADAPAMVLASQRIPTRGKQVPIPFEIAYDPAAIESGHTYAVRARLDCGGGRVFGSTEAVLVISRGITSPVEIVVRPLQ